MTLLELLETNGHCTLLDVSVRGDGKSESLLVQRYRIGSRAELYRHEYEGTAPANSTNLSTMFVIVIQKPLHVQDNGAENYKFGLVEKSIPKELRDLQVIQWNCSSEYGCKITDCRHFYVDVASGIETAAAIKKRVLAEAAKKNESEEIRIAL